MATSLPSPPSSPNPTRLGGTLDHQRPKNQVQAPSIKSTFSNIEGKQPQVPVQLPPKWPGELRKSASTTSSSITVSQKSQPVATKTEPKLDPKTLKTLLMLDDGKCGSAKLDLKSPSCKNPIKKENSHKIDKQIQNLLPLSQSSPALKEHLEELVLLVHCEHHDHVQGQEYPALRIKKWTQVFPVGQGLALPSIQDQIKEVLSFNRRRCVGLKEGNMDCNNKTGGQRSTNIKNTIIEILEEETYTVDKELLYMLKVLATNAICHAHREQVSDKVEEWRSQIIAIKGKAPRLAMEQEESKKLEVVQLPSPVSTPKKKPIPSIENGDTSLSSSPISSTSDAKETQLRRSRHITPPAEYWPDEEDKSAIDFKRRKDRAEDKSACYEIVRRQVLQPLVLADEIKKGYIYLYQVEGNPGFLKLGYTTQTIKQRHDQWQEDCNRVPKLVFPISLTSVKPVPHALRVEALCHAELDHCNVYYDCDACGKRHKEWFKVSEQEAIAVIQKWSAWARTVPYKNPAPSEPIGIVKAANPRDDKLEKPWLLRVWESDEAKDMTKFMKGLDVYATPLAKIASPPPAAVLAARLSTTAKSIPGPSTTAKTSTATATAVPTPNTD
jgi:hypothetical protein